MVKPMHTARFVTTGAVLLLTACSTMQSEDMPLAPEPLLPPPVVTSTPPHLETDGSLWNHATSQSLWRDPVATSLYDIVYVDVSEVSTATSVAETDLQRDSTLKYAIPNFLGLENRINTITDDDPTDGVDLANLVNATTNNDFSGEGETVRRSSLTARVSAQVVEVFPNGNMRIYGSQVVTVNNERQILTVEGIIRPADIGPGNAVDSARLAESRIEYTGRGVMADIQRPGLVARALNWIWPF